MSRDLATEFLTDRVGMAHVLGCSVNHINKLAAKGMPRRSRGQYSIPECVQWMLSDVTTRSRVDPDELPAVVEARTRLYVAQEQRTRLETRRLAGELLEADDVLNRMMQLASVLVTGLEGLPTRAAEELAHLGTAAEISAKLREYCNATRNEIARECASLEPPDSNDSGGDTGTPDQKCGRLGRRGAQAAADSTAPGSVGN